MIHIFTSILSSTKSLWKGIKFDEIFILDTNNSNNFTENLHHLIQLTVLMEWSNGSVEFKFFFKWQ